MTIDNIAGFFLGRDKSKVNTKTRNYNESDLNTPSLIISENKNPDELRKVRNKFAEYNSKQDLT